MSEYLRWSIVERFLEGLSHSKSSISRVFLQFQKYGCVEDLLLLGKWLMVHGATGMHCKDCICDVERICMTNKLYNVS